MESKTNNAPTRYWIGFKVLFFGYPLVAGQTTRDLVSKKGARAPSMLFN
jgi:hypothetical protein